MLDAEGALLASTSEFEDGTSDFAADPVLGEMITELVTVTGYQQIADSIYQLAGVPLGSDGELVGFLVLGLEVGPDFTADIKDNSQNEFAIFSSLSSGAAPIQGTLSTAAMTVLSNFLTLQSIEPGATFEIVLDSQRWLGVSGPLSPLTPDVGVSVSLTSLDNALQGFQQLRNLLLGVGLFSVLLAIGIG